MQNHAMLLSMLRTVIWSCLRQEILAFRRRSAISTGLRHAEIRDGSRRLRCVVLE